MIKDKIEVIIKKTRRELAFYPEERDYDDLLGEGSVSLGFKWGKGKEQIGIVRYIPESCLEALIKYIKED